MRKREFEKAICVECNKEYLHKAPPSRPRVVCSPKCQLDYVRKMRKPKPCGSEHPNWIGDKVGYYGVHDWIAKEKGRPMKCSKCGFESDNPKRIHWANISGKYLRDVSDWVRLCVRCHFKMDRIQERGWITRKAKMQCG